MSNYPQDPNYLQNPNYSSQNQRLSQDRRFGARSSRDDNYGRSFRDNEERDAEYDNPSRQYASQYDSSQRRGWQQETSHPRNFGSTYGGAGNYYSNSGSNPGSYTGSGGNYPGAGDDYGYGANPEGLYERQQQRSQNSAMHRSGRDQHREPWPRNEDRENYSPDPRNAGNDSYAEPKYYGGNSGYGRDLGYAQNYSPDYSPDYSPNYSPSSPSYSQGYDRWQNSGSVQGWQERDNAQIGAFGIQSHRGKGPRGYTRSDERIKEDVCERLSAHHYIDASAITVEVKDGVVTLEGSIADRWQKYQAEDLIDATSGVKDINNRLAIKRIDQSEARNESTEKSKTVTSATTRS